MVQIGRRKRAGGGGDLGGEAGRTGRFSIWSSVQIQVKLNFKFRRTSWKKKYIKSCKIFFDPNVLLPPADEVIFSEVSVILFTGGRGLPTGGSASGGSAYRWSLHLGVGQTPQVCLRGSVLRGIGQTTPSPDSEKRAVCILLEYFLVSYEFWIIRNDVCRLAEYPETLVFLLKLIFVILREWHKKF